MVQKHSHTHQRTLTRTYTHAKLQAYTAGDGRAAAEFSRKGRQYGELAKEFRHAANEEVGAGNVVLFFCSAIRDRTSLACVRG